jgi:predicted RecB family nuclease
VIQEAVIFPVYFYSIKDLAKHLKYKWRHEKAGGAQSIFWYEKWLETEDRKVLRDIVNYNEDDVRATEFLHNWLV